MMIYTLRTNHTGPLFVPLVYREASQLRAFGFPVLIIYTPLVSLKPILHYFAQS